MNLIRDSWSKQDITQFQEYAQSLIGDSKSCEWEQKIVNTKLKCFGKTSSKARLVAKEIKKGDIYSFLNNIEIKTHFDSLVVAFLINGIKDFDTFKQFLDKFVYTIDNWASCDTLSFKKKDLNKLYDLSIVYLKNSKPFVRRVGVNICFELIKDKTFLSKVFDILDSLQNETEYYVNMAGAWLLCECMVKYRDETIKYFERNKTNSFVINKSISKCHDSFRVSKDDKILLNKFKIK